MGTIMSKVTGLLVGALPPAYFKKKAEMREPVAPVAHLLTGFYFQVAGLIVAFAVMVWYFSTSPTLQTVISPTILKDHDCISLNPKTGTTYYSKATSENAQFASPSMKFQACKDMLTALKVCSGSIRSDHLTAWGVTNPNNSQYFPGGSGYYSFTPTQTQGLSTQLAQFFGGVRLLPQARHFPDVYRDEHELVSLQLCQGNRLRRLHYIPWSR